MVYIVKKIINGNKYYYLKNSVRIGTKVVSKNIAYMGKKRPTKAQIEEKLKAKNALSPPAKYLPAPLPDAQVRHLFKPLKNSLVMLSIQDMATFCKKKGFIFQNSEIYGGFFGLFDYGTLGVEMKNNIKQAFWKTFVQQREDVVGIDGAIITHPTVWKASGHVDSFTDYIYKCPKCKQVIKGDNNAGMKCPKCNEDMANEGKFNLMFSTQVGPASGNVAYLRPETAQVIFTNYKLVQESARQKLPFGIAQIGKAFRNEISPRDFLFRSREFEQFEIEYFINPEKECPYALPDMEVQIWTRDNQKKNEEHITLTIKDLVEKKICSKWHAYWLSLYYQFFIDHGITKENLRLREHLNDELAHYACACFDIEYRFPFGWKEIHGNADRGQFDLKQHMEFSKASLEYYDEESKQKIIPTCASEPSQGIDRAFLAFMYDAYHDDTERGNIILALDPKIAPIKVGVFPLVNKLDDEAKKLFDDIKKEFVCIYDRSGSVGRRYARADEQGIPFCITFDFDSLTDASVTIRDRDTTQQVRVKINQLPEKLRGLLNGKTRFDASK